MTQPGSQFLHERNPQLHASEEVENVIGYLRAGGESIPNEPAEKISAYLGFLANRDYVNDGILTGDQESIDRQIAAHVIKSEDVPEGYFELQRRIAREQGHGDIEITSEMRRLMTEAIQADQRSGLGKWVEYLGGEDGGYPDWFKHYTWTSITRLGTFDKEKQEFGKRSRGTTAPYPELNREALAYVFDVLNKSKVQGEPVQGGANDEKLAGLLKSANFGKLYAHAVLEVTPDSPELRKETKGSWTKFNQSDDPRTARRLSGSLQGHGTGWCTAGESTATLQLRGGDFYVYYTRDEDGKDTVPRVAIRMEDGQVAEVRGVNAAQELKAEMADITAERLKDLPGGEEYIQKAEDMKRLTAIEKRISADPTAQLTREEIRFLYEFDREIQGFGYERDPRVAAIRAKRGEVDYPELKPILIESLREQAIVSFNAYTGVGQYLNGMRSRRNRVELIDYNEFEKAITSKIEQWRQDGSLDWCVAQMAEYGGRITLNATPNAIFEPDEIMNLAKAFGERQPYEIHIDNELYNAYSGEELSGPLVAGSKVKLSLTPTGLDNSLTGTIEHQQRELASRRGNTPSLKVLSVLESVCRWYTLRAQGDRLADSTAYKKTIIRQFDLEPKRLGRWGSVPRVYVDDDGEPNLDNSDAEFGSVARLSVG